MFAFLMLSLMLFFLCLFRFKLHAELLHQWQRVIFFSFLYNLSISYPGHNNRAYFNPVASRRDSHIVPLPLLSYCLWFNL